jgi:tripartite-type tricarboxylate transporter receptor subunit TctC
LVTLMVPFPVGGASDGFARAIGPRLAKALNSTVIVENMPGASGSLAANKVLGRAAAGDMLFLASPTELVLAPATLQSVRYKPEDFRSLGFISRAPLALYVRADLPAGSADELVAWAKARADKPPTYGSVGVGSIFHLAGEAFAEASGLALTHVPYKGGAPLLQDLMGGHVDMVLFPADGTMAKQVAGGKIKPLAVTGATRSPAFPSVPTFAESKALAKFSTVDVWGGVFIPTATPAALTEAMYRAVQAALADPEAQQQLQTLAGVPLLPAMSMAQAAQFYEAEIRSYRQAVAKAKLQPS